MRHLPTGITVKSAMKSQNRRLVREMLEARVAAANQREEAAQETAAIQRLGRSALACAQSRHVFGRDEFGEAVAPASPHGR